MSRPEFVRPTAINATAVKRRGTPVFLSGQVGSGSDGAVAAGDVSAQAEQVFANVRVAVEACGGTLDDVVKLTIYVTEFDARPAIAAVRRSVFREREHPATTYVVVAGLALPEYLVEVEAIAMLDF